MDAADPAGREHRDPRGVRRDHRRRHRRGRPAAARERRRQARPRGLAHRPAGAVASAGSAAVVEPDEQPPVVDRHGRRAPRRASRTAASEARRDLEVLRVRQAVADQGRFEGDDRPALGQGGRGVGVPGRPRTTDE